MHSKIEGKKIQYLWSEHSVGRRSVVQSTDSVCCMLHLLILDNIICLL